MKLFSLTTLFTICFFCFKANAENFIVINNNDSGTGSLREAILKANSTPEKDLISFDIVGTSEASRTITLFSQLPVITSSVSIDGTTQPGNPFGRSSAKIIIQPDPGKESPHAFVLKNVDGVEFYGLYVRDFKGRILNSTSLVAFIYAENVKNLQIGAPNKGNVITNCSQLLLAPAFSIPDGQVQLDFGIENLKIKSNFIGFEPDGKTVRGTTIGLSGGAWLTLSKGTYEIGGDDDLERNYFANMSVFFRVFYAQTKTGFYEFNLVIKNNYFEFDIDGQARLVQSFESGDTFMVLYQNLTGDVFPPLPGSATILNNKVLNRFSVQMYNLTGKIKFQGNQFLPHPNVIYSNFGKNIRLTSTESVKVGGESPGEANILYDIPVYINSTKSAIAQRNNIYCNIENKNGDVLLVTGGTLPKVNITSETNNIVTGTATPGSKVELFADDNCITCQPQTYLTTILVDGTGNWSYSGNFNKGIIASATLNGYTSAYTKFNLKYTMVLKHATCNENNGSITGVEAENAIAYSWTNESNEVVGNTLNIVGLKPGKYKLTLKNMTCSRTFDELEIKDLTPRINDVYYNKIDPTCERKGSINNLYLPNQYDYVLVWTNQLGEKVSEVLNPQNLPSGNYTLSVKYKNECEIIYGPVILKSASNPIVLTETNLEIKNTVCGQSVGSIKGLRVSEAASANYNWISESGKTVGTDLDLMNVGAGKYILEVKNPSNCSVVYSSKFEIIELNAVEINSDKVSLTNVSCSIQNGSINGIVVSGATKYKWLNERNEVVSTELQLSNVTAGNYRLEVSNNFCSKTTDAFTISHIQNLISISSSIFKPRNASCGLKNGAIEFTINNASYMPKSYYWTNDDNNIVGTENIIKNIAAGNYHIYGVDENNCSILLGSQKIFAVENLSIDDSSILNIATTCNQNNGSITGIRINGGAPPFSYQWFDSKNQLINEKLDIKNIHSGNYELKVTDAYGCSVVTKSFKVENKNMLIESPIISPITLCSAAEAEISIKNFTPGNEYMLYNSEHSKETILKISDGKFKIFLTPDKPLYLTRKIGTCESIRVKIEVYFGMLGTVIPNSFSPNGDSINDRWEIKGIENCPHASVQIFSRSGAKIFESIGYKSPFDGTYKNTPLAIGVYYFIINFGSDCKQITGDIILIR